MPFQPGNQEAKKATNTRPWKEAINRAIKRRESVDPLALEKLADKLIAGVEAGDIAAIKEFGDRVDGKVAQAIIGGDDDDPAIQTRMVVEFVRPLMLAAPTEQEAVAVEPTETQS